MFPTIIDSPHRIDQTFTLPNQQLVQSAPAFDLGTLTIFLPAATGNPDEVLPDVVVPKDSEPAPAAE